MRNLCLDLSPPIPKLHSVIREDHRNSIVDRLSMVFFVFGWMCEDSQTTP